MPSRADGLLDAALRALDAKPAETSAASLKKAYSERVSNAVAEQGAERNPDFYECDDGNLRKAQ